MIAPTRRAQQLGEQLAQLLPLPDDYNRNDAASYESYRTDAMRLLRAHSDLSAVAAQLAVDDAIAHLERCSRNYKMAKIQEEPC